MENERYIGMAIIFGGVSKGGARTHQGPNSFNFMQFWGKFGKIVCWRPLAPPPRGNPGYTTDFIDDHTACPVILPLTELPHSFLQLASVPKLVNCDLFDQVLTRNILGEDGRHFDLGMSPEFSQLTGSGGSRCREEPFTDSFQFISISCSF